MDTYHAAFWSSDPSRFSSSEEEDEIPYNEGEGGERGIPSQLNQRVVEGCSFASSSTVADIKCTEIQNRFTVN